MDMDIEKAITRHLSNGGRHIRYARRHQIWLTNMTDCVLRGFSVETRTAPMMRWRSYVPATQDRGRKEKQHQTALSRLPQSQEKLAKHGHMRADTSVIHAAVLPPASNMRAKYPSIVLLPGGYAKESNDNATIYDSNLRVRLRIWLTRGRTNKPPHRPVQDTLRSRTGRTHFTHARRPRHLSAERVNSSGRT